MSNTFIYEYGESLYLNLTNRCSNRCSFCLREYMDGVGDNTLWLTREPESGELITALEDMDLDGYREVVFCGFGEPTYRLEVIKTVGKYLRSRGKYVRLDTNGQGSLINGRDISSELPSAVDFISVSLNNAQPADYVRECNPEYGESAHTALIDFTRACVRLGMRVQMSVVDTIPPEEIEACRAIAKSVGATLRVREKY